MKVVTIPAMFTFALLMGASAASFAQCDVNTVASVATTDDCYIDGSTNTDASVNVDASTNDNSTTSNDNRVNNGGLIIDGNSQGPVTIDNSSNTTVNNTLNSAVQQAFVGMKE